MNGPTPGGNPEVPPRPDPNFDPQWAGPPNELENFFACFSGADYHITAVIPYKDRFEKAKQRVEGLEAAIAKIQDNPAEQLTLHTLKQELLQAQSATNSPKAFFKTFGEIQTLSITTRRSVEPVRNLGEPSPAFYCRGPRTVAGSMVFVMLAEDPLMDLYKIADHDKFDREPAFIQDRMPPFNVIITGFNEYGRVVEGALMDVTLLASGMTLSIDDLYTEIQYTYVARWMLPMATRTRKNAIAARIGLPLLSPGFGRASDLASPPRLDVVNPDGFDRQFRNVT